MPEQPEISIMSNFFNSKIETGYVTKVEKSPMSKNKCDLSVLNDGRSWRATSQFRGKEMLVTFTCEKDVHSLKLGFARIGAMYICEADDIPENFDKVAMLRFYTSKGKIVYLYDYTRYSQWRWCPTWDPSRSPDIVVEHNEWRDHLYKYRKIKYFKQPIFDIILDQKYFNGIGNFSRSEILCRTLCSPFMNFDEILESDTLRTDFFEVCRETLRDIADLGGLQFKYWINPFGVKKQKFNRWVRCYKKLPKTFYQKDSKGRLFWFDKRYLLDYSKWAQDRLKKDNEIQDIRLLTRIYRYKSKIKK